MPNAWHIGNSMLLDDFLSSSFLSIQGKRSLALYIKSNAEILFCGLLNHYHCKASKHLAILALHFVIIIRWKIVTPNGINRFSHWTIIAQNQIYSLIEWSKKRDSERHGEWGRGKMDFPSRILYETTICINRCVYIDIMDENVYEERWDSSAKNITNNYYFIFIENNGERCADCMRNVWHTSISLDCVCVDLHVLNEKHSTIIFFVTIVKCHHRLYGVRGVRCSQFEIHNFFFCS